ncbi:hypothetical protein ACI2JA_04050 [Alkalihalobacillus sp. NPDC078783]
MSFFMNKPVKKLELKDEVLTKEQLQAIIAELVHTDEQLKALFSEMLESEEMLTTTNGMVNELKDKTSRMHRVSMSGDYNDLLNLPTIKEPPKKTSDLENDKKYATTAEVDLAVKLGLEPLTGQLKKLLPGLKI